MNIIDQRLSALRGQMDINGYDFVVIPSNDPHFSEYTPNYWKCREFISGFDGSAGRVVVSKDEALLWSDSRYFIQAEEQLKESSFGFMKEGLEQTPSIEEYISGFSNKRVALNANLISISDFENFGRCCGDNVVVDCGDIFESLWSDRLEIGDDAMLMLSEDVVGESVISKVSRVRKEMSLGANEIYLVSPLDQSAWLLNLRGCDIDYNPVNVCYTVVESDKVLLFMKNSKVDDQIRGKLEDMGVSLSDYNDFEEYLSASEGKTFILNCKYTSQRYYNILAEKNSIVFEEDPNGIITTMKSVKNSVEIQGFKKAMIEDGVALTKFYMWLERGIADGVELTEYMVGRKLEHFRSLSPLYYSESFGAIVGYGSNGAIVHYHAEEPTSATLKADNFLLIDSGAQYLCGTTDITRTVHLGEPTDRQKLDFTLVLQGHVNLAMAIFPKNSRGAQLDFLARQPLCAHSMNFLHGTGHGVGHFLNVHEGPQSIRMNENPVVLKCGMVTSNEPALYKQGEYGIRTENLILCTPHSTSDFGEFHSFETLTLFPYDMKSVDRELLTKDQKEWIESYHAMVYEKLSPHLSATEQEWLKRACEL